jgi:hypothetical protein
MRVLAVLGLSTLTLTACNAGDRPARVAATLPSPKPGLWRESLMRDGHDIALIGDMRACLDADARKRLSTLGEKTDSRLCQERAVTRDADGGYHFSSTCELGPAGRVTTQGELTGDLASRYRVHTQTETTGASMAAANGRHVIDVEADYLGPCPAGMVPGDVMIANGVKVNLHHLRALAQALTDGG